MPNPGDAWPMYLDILLAQIPDDEATIQEVEELLHEYRNDLIDLVTSRFDQGDRCKGYHHISDQLRERLEAIIEESRLPQIPEFPPEVPDVP